MGPDRARSRSVFAASAVIAATLVLLSGCGGGSSSNSRSSSSASSATASSSSTSQTSQTSQGAGQFKAAVAPVLDQFKSASQATGAALQHANSKTDAQLAATFQRLGTKWSAGLTSLETLQPPPQLIAAYNRLKSQVSQVDADLAAIVSDAQTHKAAAARASATKLVNDIVSAKTTSTTLSSANP